MKYALHIDQQDEKTPAIKLSLTHEAHSRMKAPMRAVLLMGIVARLGPDRLAPAPVGGPAGIRVGTQRIYHHRV